MSLTPFQPDDFRKREEIQRREAKQRKLEAAQRRREAKRREYSRKLQIEDPILRKRIHRLNQTTVVTLIITLMGILIFIAGFILGYGLSVSVVVTISIPVVVVSTGLLGLQIYTSLRNRKDFREQPTHLDY